MNFNSIEFLLIHLPITLVVFYLCKPKFRIAVLLISSIIFYAPSGMFHLLSMAMCIVWSFAFGLFQEKNKNKAILAGAIFLPLISLYLFKYLNYTLTIFHAPASLQSFFQPLLAISLPAGISFYSFHIMAYNFDVYRSKIESEKRFMIFATFVAFFPQLIAGPILRFSQIRDQLVRISAETLPACDWKNALKYLSIGLFYKTFFSDVLRTMYSTYNYQANPAFSDSVFMLLAYAIVIYYDFWSYSLMAIGLGKLFSVEIPINFREPYIAKNPNEFWQRWHITLSSWLKDYIFTPIGGVSNYSRNIMIIFIACGIWHGARTGFIIWGAYHGLLIVLYRYARPWWDKMPSVFQTTFTFCLVSLVWPLFFYQLHESALFYKTLLQINLNAPALFTKQWLFVIFISLWMFFLREEHWLWKNNKWNPIEYPIIQALVIFLSMSFFTYAQTFIYFRF